MFKTVLLPVGRELEPESLADHPAYQFFYRMGRDGNGSPHPCPIEHLTNPAMPVSREFDRLATDLCRRLREIEEQPCTGEAAPSVYVARSALRAHHARLCEELHNKGYRVVSEAPWPGSTSEEFSQRVASRLVEASASIHLWAGGSARTPEAHAVSDLELSSALDVAGRPDKTRFRVYYWDAAGTAAWDGARRLTSSPAVVNFAGKDWEFSLSNIFISLAQRAAEPADSGPEPENAECTHRVFLHCLEEDRAHAAAIREHFLRRRIWLWFLPQPLSFWIRKRRSPIDQEVASQHESWCRESHGALVLLNNGPEIWANARCREIEAANGRSRGVAVVPPEDLRKKSFGYPAFTKYWTPELDRYIDRLIGRDGK